MERLHSGRMEAHEIGSEMNQQVTEPTIFVLERWSDIFNAPFRIEIAVHPYAYLDPKAQCIPFCYRRLLDGSFVTVQTIHMNIDQARDAWKNSIALNGYTLIETRSGVFAR